MVSLVQYSVEIQTMNKNRSEVDYTQSTSRISFGKEKAPVVDWV